MGFGSKTRDMHWTVLQIPGQGCSLGRASHGGVDREPLKTLSIHEHFVDNP